LLFNHHFLPPKDENTFSFLPGEYVIDIYARTIMQSATVLLPTVKVALTEKQAAVLRDKNKGILFTWGRCSKLFRAH
jgi:hypothetical protein